MEEVIDSIDKLYQSLFKLEELEKNDIEYRKKVNKIFNKYKQILERINSETIFVYQKGVKVIEITGDFICKTGLQLIDGLSECLNSYYNGNIFKSLEQFKIAIQGDIKNFTEVFKVIEFNSDDYFFRLRKNIDNKYDFEKHDLYHIPFHLRSKISTQRFSIPGFPSLYLGSSVYLCWEELNRENLEDLTVAKYKVKEPIRVLDLTRLNENADDRDKYLYFLTFPLIIACSLKVKNNEDPFKPEYIIPQLLLNFCRNETEFEGIKYNSTKISKCKVNSFEHYNVVFPVKTNQNKDYCKKLLSYFDISEPINIKTFINTDPGLFYRDNTKDLILSRRYTKFELLKHKEKFKQENSYLYSMFGRIEYYLI